MSCFVSDDNVFGLKMTLRVGRQRCARKPGSSHGSNCSSCSTYDSL